MRKVLIAQHWARLPSKRKIKEKDSQQDISTSKICLYDRTTTYIMKNEKKTYIYDKRRHTLWDTCWNIVMRLQKMAFVYYQDRLSWKWKQFLKKNHVPMPDKTFINQLDIRFQPFTVLGQFSNQLHKPIRGFSMCRQLALHRIVLPIYNGLKFKLASQTNPRI